MFVFKSIIIKLWVLSLLLLLIGIFHHGLSWPDKAGSRISFTSQVHSGNTTARNSSISSRLSKKKKTSFNKKIKVKLSRDNEWDKKFIIKFDPKTQLYIFQGRIMEKDCATNNISSVFKDRVSYKTKHPNYFNINLYSPYKIFNPALYQMYNFDKFCRFLINNNITNSFYFIKIKVKYNGETNLKSLEPIRIALGQPNAPFTFFVHVLNQIILANKEYNYEFINIHKINFCFFPFNLVVYNRVRFRAARVEGGSMSFKEYVCSKIDIKNFLPVSINYEKIHYIIPVIYDEKGFVKKIEFYYGSKHYNLQIYLDNYPRFEKWRRLDRSYTFFLIEFEGSKHILAYSLIGDNCCHKLLFSLDYINMDIMYDLDLKNGIVQRTLNKKCRIYIKGDRIIEFEILKV